LALEVVYYAIKPLLPSMSTGYEFMTLTVFYTAMTFLLSVLMHDFVELPFMAIGRKLSARVKPDLVIQP
jgi:peptidoglycan/LPS O-acetylase OafA/YrhL